MNQHLTTAVVRQFGVAFGLWGYSLDIALTGRAQQGTPDLVAVEESTAYAAVLTMIEEQDPPRVVKKQIAGVSVYEEEKPSELYRAMREGMFEAYHRAVAAAEQCGQEVIGQGREPGLGGE